MGMLEEMIQRDDEQWERNNRASEERLKREADARRKKDAQTIQRLTGSGLSQNAFAVQELLSMIERNPGADFYQPSINDLGFDGTIEAKGQLGHLLNTLKKKGCFSSFEASGNAHFTINKINKKCLKSQLRHMTTPWWKDPKIIVGPLFGLAGVVLTIFFPIFFLRQTNTHEHGAFVSASSSSLVLKVGDSPGGIVNNSSTVGTEAITNNFYYAAPKQSKAYGNFPESVKNVLEKNKTEPIEIFAETGNKEAGDYACAIQDGLRGAGFVVPYIWPDADSEAGFADMWCIQNKYQSQRQLFLPVLKDFKTVSSSTPFVEADGIKLFDLDSRKMVLWITK